MRQTIAQTVQRTNSEESNSQVIATCVDESGERLVCAHANGNLTIWRPKNSTGWEQTICFETAHAENSISQITFAPSRIHPCMVATAGRDGIIVLVALSSYVDGDAGQAIHTILQSRGVQPITAVSFSETGMLAARCGKEVIIYECDSADGRGIDVDACKWHHISDVQVDDQGDGVSFAPGGAFFVSGSCIVRRVQGEWHWEVMTTFETDEIQMFDSKNVCCVHWGSAGFIGTATDDNQVQIWQLKRGKLIRLFEIQVEHKMRSLQWDRAGTMLAGMDVQGFTSTFGRKYSNGQWQWEREHLKLKIQP